MGHQSFILSSIRSINSDILEVLIDTDLSYTKHHTQNRMRCVLTPALEVTQAAVCSANSDVRHAKQACVKAAMFTVAAGVPVLAQRCCYYNLLLVCRTSERVTEDCVYRAGRKDIRDS